MIVFAGFVAAMAGDVRFEPLEGDAYHPVWSPDGRELAFEVHRDEDVDVYLARPAEAAVDAVRIQLARGDAQLQNPFPTGNGRVVLEARDARRSQIWWIGTHAPTVRHLLGDHRSLAVRHDGMLGFVRATAQDAELWVYTPGMGAQRLTWTLAEESYPAFAPDDERIAFQRTWEGRHGIVVQDLDNTRGVEIAEGERPAWAWDEIVFFRGDNIAVVRPGQAPRVLATGVLRPSRGPPAVTPDGAWVLWTDGSRISATSLDGALTIDIPAEHEHLADLAVADRDGALVLAYTWSVQEGAFRQLHTKSLADDLPLAAPVAVASPKRWGWATSLALLLSAAALLASRIARRRGP